MFTAHQRSQRAAIRRYIQIAAFVVSIFLMLTTFTSSVYAAGTLTLDVTIVDPLAGPVQTGVIVEYVIDFSCASTTTDCGNLNIDFQMDSEFDWDTIEVIAPPGYTGVEDSGTGIVNVQSVGAFLDGAAGQVTVRARVSEDLVDLELNGDVTGTITNTGDPGDDITVPVDGPPLEIEVPQGGWNVTKNQTVPSGTVGPALDGTASFTVSVCPISPATGVARISPPVTFVDRIPPGAEFAPGGNPDGGVISDELDAAGLGPGDLGFIAVDGVNDTITWTINSLTPDPWTSENGCIEVDYTLRYPDAAFDVNDPTNNTVYVTAPSPDDPFNDGVCTVPDCIGGDGTTGTVDDPTVTAGGSKSGPGTSAIVAPGANDGTSEFDISWNLSEANTSTTNFIVEDVLPATVSDPTISILEVTEVNSGTWSGSFNAALQYQLTYGGAWTTFATVDGSSNQNFTAPADFPDDVVGIRWNFTGNTLPAGFSSNGASIRFFVRDGLTTADYELAPDPFRDYQNCLDFSGSYFDEVPAVPPAVDFVQADAACTTLQVGGEPTGGFTNINTRKSTSPSAVFPTEDMTFTLEIDLTQEASGNLINPMIQDILPLGMQITRWDNVEYLNFVGGDPSTVFPYLAIDELTVDGDQRQRLRFYYDNTNILTNSYTCATFPCTMDTIIDNGITVLDGTTATVPGVTNAFSLTPPDSLFKTIRITFTAQARADTPAGDGLGIIPYANDSVVITDNDNLVCQSGIDGTEDTDLNGDTVPDVTDLDEDGTDSEAVCETSSTYEIREAAQMNSQKWIRSITGPFPFVDSNNLDNPTPTCPTFSYDTATSPGAVDFTRFPCVAQGVITSATGDAEFEYLMRITNTGLVDVEDYILYDILPHEPDFGISQATTGQARNSEFRTFLVDPIVIEEVPTGLTTADFTIEYYIGNATDYNPNRPEVSNTTDEVFNWSGGGNAWTGTFPTGAPDTVTAFRVRLNAGQTIVPGGQLVLSLPMEFSQIAGEAETGEIGWNNFAQRFTNAPSNRRLLTAEPRKVGIIVEERYSVGNRIWLDEGAGGGTANDGIINGTEPGMNGVTVELYQNGTLYAIDETRTDTSSGLDGYYFFGDLPGRDASGALYTYYVRIPETEFQVGGILEEYANSTGEQSATPNNDTDSNDTGQDPATIADYTTLGVRSADFTFTRNGETTADNDVNDDGNTFPPLGGSPNDPTDEGQFGRGENFEQDADSDLTVDFGFYRVMGLGNRVWLDDGDDGSGGTIPAQENDGIINGGEAGIENVVLRLYASDGTTEIEDPTNPGNPYEVTTDANGYYLFDLLPPGQYVVRVMPENFQFGATEPDDGPLADYISSVPASPADANPSNDTDDRTDHGIDPATDGDQRTDGVYSAIITLEPTNETTSELPADKGPGGDGRRNNPENSSDLTVDFGFWEESTTFSLGNFVWDDFDNDGVYDAGDGELPIENVVVELYPDNDNNGIPDGGTLAAPGTPLATDITDVNGFYLFDNLDPGRYVVRIAPDNFNTGNPLIGYVSSTDVGGRGDDNERDTDFDENGQDPTDGNSNNSIADEHAAVGVYSTTILLEPEGEPINETDGGEVPNPSGSAEDDNSDITVDFGFVRLMSIGNLVWLDNGDDGSGGTIPAQRNDGIVNGGEAGVAGVNVNLYFDADDSGTLDAGELATPVATDTTDANGYYLFSGLARGSYLVEIPFTGNFDAGGVLQYHESSIPPTPFDENIAGNDDDNRDHGIFASDTQVTAPGVRSALITLAYTTEPTTDTDVSGDPLDGPEGRGNFGETDDNSDLTVDFGFYTPPLSVGNRVWRDNGADAGAPGGINAAQYNDGILNGDEAGIENILVNLYGDFDGDGAEDATPITTNTDAQGYYLFDNLLPGDYRVELDQSNFDPSGALEGLISSSGNGTDNQQDSDVDENGVDPVDGNANNSVLDEYQTNGVTSVTISLLPRVERDDEADLGPDGNGTDVAPNGSDLTIDFGLYEPMSLGNRVWLDNGAIAGGTDPSQHNDGILNGTEVGISGVTVNLYRDTDQDGTLAGAELTPIATDTTDATGYYLFDGLYEGQYFVEIPAGNFSTNTDPLFELQSSTDPIGGNADGDVDNDDHGNDPVSQGDAVFSPPILLSLAAPNEPTGEDVSGDPTDGPDGRGSFGETDDNSDLTVDFGFVAPPMSLGNRVFIDDGDDGTNPTQFDDGTQNGTEPGVENVVVNLYFDANNNGAIDGAETTPIATDTTDANGYYLFDGLPTGNYVVAIDGDNFDAGADGIVGTGDDAPLAGYISSTLEAGDNQTDLDDNGQNTPNTALGNDIASPIINLTTSAEQTGENEGPEGRGSNGETDVNSDLTVDFGFLRPMSIGNRVWLDIERATGTPGDGVRQAPEQGIGGVAVQLYLDNGNGTFEIGTDTLIAETTTTGTGLDANNGYYLFDSTTTVTAPSVDDPNDSPIGPGNYFVHIPAANFATGAPLVGLINSDGTNASGTDTQTDSVVGGGDENGVNTLTQRIDGVTSTVIALRYDNEPLAAVETDRDPNRTVSVDGVGRVAAPTVDVEDDNSDLTIDFAFYRALSIGNRVWYDSNRDGTIDPTDDNPNAPGMNPGIDGVTVYLYRDADENGVLEGAELTPIATDVTSNGGYYLFDQTGDQSILNGGELLTAGNYVVGIDPTVNAATLANHTSTFTRVGGTGLDAPVDNDDNGIDQRDVDPDPTIIYSEIINLEDGAETTAEADADKEAGVGDGRYAIKDESSNLTVDFGFFIPMSIGNRVWRDNGADSGYPGGFRPTQFNNGVLDGDEVGINGVTVHLYLDANDNGVIDGAETTEIDTATTDSQGYYLFDDLVEGQYFVGIPADNFDNVGDPLEGLESSTDPTGGNADGDVDNDDHGNDPATPGLEVLSPPIVLTLDSEPSPDVGTPADDSEAVTGTGANGEIDINSDLTVDFGFVAQSFSLGNRVFFDSGDNGTNPAQFDDGTQNGTEPGVANVVVDLYFDANGNNSIDAGEFVGTDTTDANGYYLFDKLISGNYIVSIPNSNFAASAPLEGYISSTIQAADNQTDLDDNGINAPDATYGILSPVINLASGAEPTSEVTSGDAGDGPNGRGNNNESDANSDLTVDFGFVRPMSIGNRVWLDIERATGTPGDGIRQAPEQGIGGVAVQLYLDSNGNNTFEIGTDTLIAETTTTGTGLDANNGYYLFDATNTVTAPGVDDPNDSPIGPGNYFVHIPAANFSLGVDGIINTADDAVLAGLINSDGANASGTDTQTDSVTGGGDENGVNTTTQLVDGVTSTVIALRYDNEPLAAVETDRDPNRTVSVDGVGRVAAPTVDVEDDNSDLTIDFAFYRALSIGNRVWFDSDRDGTIDATDDNPNAPGANPGIDGVTVYLYRDDNADGVPDGAFIASDVTSNGGYYLFDQTGDQATPNGGELLSAGNYIVGIDPTAGSNSTLLLNHISTETRVGGTGLDAAVDNDDNGIDQRDVDPDPTIIYSESINLTHDLETTAEANADKETGVLDGRYGIQDDSSNLTVDFGFYVPMSIGNRVWLDDNDGVIDGTEDGINGVLMELFRDNGSGINPATDTPYRTTVTNTGNANGNGYYIFDDLPEGSYVVRVAPRNFQNLTDDGDPTNGTEGALVDGTGAPYSSSESGSAPQDSYLLDNQTDNNDNGIDENSPQTNGLVSNPITLTYNTEPDGAADDTPDLDPDVGEGTFGELDRNADMTVDFGVYTPRMSIGNRVFLDYNNNRIFDGADVGHADVIMNLFEDSDQNGLPDTGINNPIATTTTGPDGYYIFDNLDPGYYLVQVDENNFRTVTNGVLQDFYSSQDKDGSNNPVTLTDDEDDATENGVDAPFNLGNNPDPQAEGVFSVTINLEPSGESSTETLGPQGNGEPNIQDTNSELTVDFGFYQPMSIGNVVWFDNDNDGLISGTEAGIAGVRVELYRDNNGDGLLDGGDTLVPVYNGTSYDNFDITDADGYYLFDNLIPGRYLVHLPPSNFSAGQPLLGHISTTPNNEPNAGIAPAPSIDSNDNGTPDDNTVATVGVTSEQVVLGVIDPNGSGLYIPGNTEPVNELDKSNNPPNPASTYDGPASIGRYGELDNNSDITIDFGFVLETTSSMSIGNRVWFDEDRSGLIENNNALGNTESGIDGVTVLLYRATVGGTPTGAPIARDVTDNGGYYLFDRLDTDALNGTGDGDDAGGIITPGNYVVVIPNSNFNTGQPLNGYVTTQSGVDNPGTVAPSTGVEAGYGAADDDNNDNGTVNPSFGIISDLVTLTLNAERDDEDAANKESGVDDGTDGASNPIATNNSDLTRDFGFYQPMSIGNRVWIDSNNNGVFDAGESPVPTGVTLTLYLNDGGTPGTFDGTNTPVDTTATDSNGYYLFDDLIPGEYIVVLDASNFGAGQTLNGYNGSNNGGTFEDDTDDDLNDNGRDVDPTINGIASGLLTLTNGSEPTSEENSSNPADGPNGRGTNGETDTNSNLTVDFGVFPSTYYSIGNRVWNDNSGATGNAGNGVHDSDETGIPNVVMNLYRDDNTDGTPDSTTPVATTTTDANGSYVFDGLSTGNYIVSVARENFNNVGALSGYSPTTPADPSDSTPNDDQDSVTDHTSSTIDNDFGFFSGYYTLEGTGEPTGETDPTGAGAPQDPGTDPLNNPIPDNQSNLTVDFGFIRSLSIGNLVWFDINNNGVYESASESGIADVTVELYDDTQVIGTDAPLATDTTDGNGYYLFDNLQPGNYRVHIPNSNWTSGRPLNGMQSSVDDATPAGDTSDNNDNGIGTGDTNPTPGVTSEVLTLAFGAAPTGESDLSNNPDDGVNFRGATNPADNNSDLTRDFGFFNIPMSLGNRVWLDDGGTGSGTPNNGILDGDEEGISGVTVELYADANNDGVPDTVSPLDATTTDAEGYYLFDGLPPGRYVVVLAESNWDGGGVLDGYLSSPDGTPDNDNQDNGVDNPTPNNNGIRSASILLEPGTEPVPDSEDVTGTGDNGETDDSSNLTVDFGLVVAYDWGDAPDSYGTTNGANGPNHRIRSSLYLGAAIDDEGDGQPVTDGTSNNTGDPDGDQADEDGMTPPTFVGGTTIDVDVTAVNDTGSNATLIGWFDWDGSGTFDDDEAYTVTVPPGTNGVVQLPVTVPDDAQDLAGDNTYARLRLTTDSIDATEPNGAKNDGEVEDYYVTLRDPGLLVSKTDGQNAIVAGTTNTYTIVIENSGDPRTGVVFRDDLPIATDIDAAGYDPETITWTCTATNGASCIANQPAGTGASGGPYPEDATSVIIEETIDLPRDGRVEYTVTARLNAAAGLVGGTTITNTAQLPNEAPPLEDSDETGIIFDPPIGVKTGTVLSDTLIRWTMVWINTGAAQTATIQDTLTPPQVFAADPNLDCQVFGTSSTTSCDIVGDQFTWTGTIGTGEPNQVVISFDVVVPGQGDYNNVATIAIDPPPGFALATVLEAQAQASVSIGDTGGDNDDDDDDDSIAAPPGDVSITKSVDPAFAKPGDTVTWTVTVTNDSGQTVDNLAFSDNVPAELNIDSIRSSQGIISQNGNTFTFNAGTLNTGQSATVNIVTTVSEEITEAMFIRNIALLLPPYDGNAEATLTVLYELPDTGETPLWRTLLLVVLTVSVVGSAATVVWRKVRLNA